MLKKIGEVILGSILWLIFSNLYALAALAFYPDYLTGTASWKTVIIAVIPPLITLAVFYKRFWLGMGIILNLLLNLLTWMFFAPEFFFNTAAQYHFPQFNLFIVVPIVPFPLNLLLIFLETYHEPI